MEFGRLDIDPYNINFTLPEDPEVTTRTLQTAGTNDELTIHVGATKWAEKKWIGKIYPKKTPDADFLKEYTLNFNSIEFGPTFYNIYKPEEIGKWTDKVVESRDFRFCPKFPQMITHIKRFVNADDATGRFYSSINAFGNQLGPLLMQLGENFSPKSFPQLKIYLESLPPDIKVALEVRNKEWFAVEEYRSDLFSLLKRLNISWIMPDTMGRRDCVHMHLPTPIVVIRFVGNDLYPTDYTRINAWVDRFKDWKEQGLKSIWFFVHQNDEATVPELCDYLIKQLNQHLGTTLKGPNLIKD